MLRNGQWSLNNSDKWNYTGNKPSKCLIRNISVGASLKNEPIKDFETFVGKSNNFLHNFGLMCEWCNYYLMLYIIWLTVSAIRR